MTNLQRVKAKIFGETATAIGEDPQIGQFGSALAGTYIGTSDIEEIQQLDAWSNGFIDCVTPDEQFPPLPEMTGVCKVLSQQSAYLMQKGVAEWNSETDYYKGDICKDIGAGKLYVSKTDNNINNALTNAAYWEEFRSNVFRNIGEIVTSTIPLTDTELHPLDGAVLYGSGIYGEFVNYIKDLYNSGEFSDLFVLEGDWQSSVATYGVCGKFVYNSVNNTVRLPKYNSKIYTGGGTAPVIGNGMSLGLTDGTHTKGMAGYYGTNVIGSPLVAMDVGTVGDTATLSSGPDLYLNSGKYVGVSTDSTKSGLIADLSNITTSLDGYYYIVVATSTKTDIQVDIDEIATDLNGKADVDLTNVSNTSGFRKLIAVSDPSIMPSWYKVYSEYDPTTGSYIGQWCEQGGSCTIGTTSYTFIKEYADIPNVQITYTSTYTGWVQILGIGFYALPTTTGFIINSSFNATNYLGANWVACGYIN